MKKADFQQILAKQDKLLDAYGIEIWVGMEPTFTRRHEQTPQWLSEALGAEKLAYAYALLQQVHERRPGGVVLHSLGRQYGGEELPRWSIGYYQARHGQFAWDAPLDPCLAPAAADEPKDIETFWQRLTQTLNRDPWRSVAFKVKDDLGYRILLRIDGGTPLIDMDNKALLARSSIHAQKVPHNGLTDELATGGDLLLCLGRGTSQCAPEAGGSIVIELPAMPDTTVFLHLMVCIGEAAKSVAVDTLFLQGFTPPVDAGIAWTTITPDPAVIEINQAPADSAVGFYDLCELHYDAAQTAGLSPYRLHYNGVVADSGGGGQFTLGGPEPLSSPFLRYPYLLPRLIRYFTAHPALSYWFAPSYIGSSSQSPRVDEGVRETFQELSVAMEQLESAENVTPEFIWRNLSPFLVDPSGNPHRSELNIEKLWNPYLPGRGCLGLVEFRAFRMSRSAECAAAIAVLLRSIVAMLCMQDREPELVNHGSELHDKYALPFFLSRDLRQVFEDLQAANLPLHNVIKTMLLHEPVRDIGRTEFHGCCIELEQAVEFWPLLGDVASQEHGGSRMVDASTTRLQLTLRAASPHPNPLEGWEVVVDGYRVPLSMERDDTNRQGKGLEGKAPLEKNTVKKDPGEKDSVKVGALRYRNFQPAIGLHPGIAARGAITLMLVHRGLDEALQITYSDWHPQGLPYPGLPVDMDDAALRRAQRFVTRVIPVTEMEQPMDPPAAALTPYCLDLRRLRR